jgi:spore maturation protein CgeB
MIDTAGDACPPPLGVRPPALLALVGFFDGTAVGGSLERAAMRLHIPVLRFDIREAYGGSRAIRAALWRLAGKRPPRLQSFAHRVVQHCAGVKPELLIATGISPLPRSALAALRSIGTACVNYSTDDPWNPAARANWFLRALPEYDVVFTTRRANIECFRSIGCRRIHHLPFGYDEGLFRAAADCCDRTAAPDVLFVGGADRDRVAFMSEFLRYYDKVGLVGGYWQRFPATRAYALGLRPPASLRALTAAAKVNLCLVRHANRDGHVMRSFEIAAIGGCMLVEDTEEHREIFGSDGDAVAYFRTPAEAAARARDLIANPARRARLAAAVRARIAAGRHTYGDRLQCMLATATPIARC